MASGPLDHETVSPTNHDSAASIPRIRNPVVESWNDEEELIPRPVPASRIPGASPYAPPAVVRAASVPIEATGLSNAKRLIPSLLVLALFLLSSSAIVVGIAAVPVQPYLITWRYSLVGSFSLELLSPLIAVTLITASLLLAERARFAKITAILFSLAGAAILPLLLFFLLDAVQMRTILDSALQGRVFFVAVGKTVVLFLTASLVLATNAYVLFRASRQWSRNDFSVSEWQR